MDHRPSRRVPGRIVGRFRPKDSIPARGDADQQGTGARRAKPLRCGEGPRGQGPDARARKAIIGHGASGNVAHVLVVQGRPAFPLLSIPIAAAPPRLAAARTRSSMLRIASRVGRCSTAENAKTRSAGVSDTKSPRSACLVRRTALIPGVTTRRSDWSAEGSRSTASVPAAPLVPARCPAKDASRAPVPGLLARGLGE